jgi:hypothetical protein
MRCVLALVLTGLLVLAAGPVAPRTRAEPAAQTLRADFLKVIDRARGHSGGRQGYDGLARSMAVTHHALKDGAN